MSTQQQQLHLQLDALRAYGNRSSRYLRTNKCSDSLNMI
ncbi:hypothetical protein [Hymenobacter qilianensis]